MQLIKTRKKELPKGSYEKLSVADGFRVTKAGGKCLINIRRVHYNSLDYKMTQEIVYDDTATIFAQGYRECIGLMTSLAYYKMPVFIRFHGYKKCNYHNGFTDDLGNVVPADTPGAYP